MTTSQPPAAPLNSVAIANAGATLVATSAGALGVEILGLAHGQHFAAIALAAPFAGILVGAALSYFGRPFTVK